jgi:hypothetical protein
MPTPAEKARIVRTAIEDRLDLIAYDEMRDSEEQVRAQVLLRLDGQPNPAPAN